MTPYSTVVVVAAGTVAVGIVAYGSFQLGKGIFEVATGEEYWTCREITTEERIDKGAGILGAFVGGGLVGRGFARGKETTIKNVRIAPFGNRTGDRTGELPHYHRAVPDPSRPGNSLTGQGKSRHRPWDSQPTDKAVWDRF